MAFKNIHFKMVAVQASAVAAMMSAAHDAQAANNFSDIASNINSSIEELPGLVTGVSYMLGLLLGVVGILKLKDHVENPTQTAMKDGAVRLAAGGALFALPIVFESMLNTIGTTGATLEAAKISKVKFNVT